MSEDGKGRITAPCSSCLTETSPPALGRDARTRRFREEGARFFSFGEGETERERVSSSEASFFPILIPNTGESLSEAEAATLLFVLRRGNNGTPASTSK